LRPDVERVSAAHRHGLAKINFELLCLRAASAKPCTAILKLALFQKFALHYLLLLDAHARLALALLQSVVNAGKMDYVVAAGRYHFKRLPGAQLVQVPDYRVAVPRRNSALLANVRLEQGIKNRDKQQKDKYPEQDLAHAHKHARGLTSFMHNKKPFKIGYKCFYGASQQ
jgi:hypothetical protein